MNLLVGPADVRVEIQTDVPFLRPICVRPAVRAYDLSEPFDAWRERLATLLPEHALDLRPVRVVYRWVRWAGRFIDDVLFGGEHEREVAWALGVLVATAVVVIAFAMLR